MVGRQVDRDDACVIRPQELLPSINACQLLFTRRVRSSRSRHNHSQQLLRREEFWQDHQPEGDTEQEEAHEKGLFLPYSEQEGDRGREPLRDPGRVVTRKAIFSPQDQRWEWPKGQPRNPSMHARERSPGRIKLIAPDRKKPLAQRHRALGKQPPLVPVWSPRSYAVDKLSGQLQPPARPEEVHTKEVVFPGLFAFALKVNIRESHLRCPEVCGQMEACGLGKRAF